MKRAARGVVVVLILIGIVGAVSAMGQEVTAAIVGTVSDPSGAPVKGATVTATDTERGTPWTAQTNDSGGYNLLRLPIGRYSLKVTAAGFDTSLEPPFTLVLNQTARVDVRLKVGKISETVEVSGAAPILQTQSTEVSTLIDANTAVSLPLASRNYLQLTLLAPGVTNPNPQTLYLNQNMTSAGRPQINGNREQSNEVLLDGLVNTEDTNNEVGYQPAPDAIQEFNVITQNASAEFGNYQGGVISAAIKSGTNHFHGNVYEFFRNDVLNANTWSAGLAIGGPSVPGTSQANGVLDKAKLRWNEFGGTFGGPIIKNKLFGFVAYQHLHVSDEEIGDSFLNVPVGLNDTNRNAGGFADIINAQYSCPVSDAEGDCLPLTAANIDPLALGLFQIPSLPGQPGKWPVSYTHLTLPTILLV